MEFDDSKVSDAEAAQLAEAARLIIMEATGIQDVFVYGNSARIKVAIAPIEIFMRLTDHKIADEKALFDEIKSKLHDWKAEVNFPHPINFTLIPMHWQFAVDL
jgi:hypothetical protein